MSAQDFIVIYRVNIVNFITISSSLRIASLPRELSKNDDDSHLAPANCKFSSMKPFNSRLTNSIYLLNYILFILCGHESWGNGILSSNKL